MAGTIQSWSLPPGTEARDPTGFPADDWRLDDSLDRPSDTLWTIFCRLGVSPTTPRTVAPLPHRSMCRTMRRPRSPRRTTTRRPTATTASRAASASDTHRIGSNGHGTGHREPPHHPHPGRGRLHPPRHPRRRGTPGNQAEREAARHHDAHPGRRLRAGGGLPGERGRARRGPRGAVDRVLRRGDGRRRQHVQRGGRAARARRRGPGHHAGAQRLHDVLLRAVRQGQPGRGPHHDPAPRPPTLPPSGSSRRCWPPSPTGCAPRSRCSTGPGGCTRRRCSPKRAS